MDKFTIQQVASVDALIKTVLEGGDLYENFKNAEKKLSEEDK